MPLKCYQRHECTWKCMMNVSVSITEEGISPNITNHRELNAKKLVFRRKVLRWFLIYLVLFNHAPNAYIDALRYLKIKRSHHYYLTEGNGGVGKNLTS